MYNAHIFILCVDKSIVCTWARGACQLHASSEIQIYFISEKSGHLSGVCIRAMSELYVPLRKMQLTWRMEYVLPMVWQHLFRGIKKCRMEKKPHFTKEATVKLIFSLLLQCAVSLWNTNMCRESHFKPCTFFCCMRFYFRFASNSKQCHLPLDWTK